jgi:hypothetical protein
MREEGQRRLADFGRYAIANEAAKKRGGATEPLATREVEGSRSRLIANKEEEEIRSSPVANEKDKPRSRLVADEFNHKRRGAIEPLDR